MEMSNCVRHIQQGILACQIQKNKVDCKEFPNVLTTPHQIFVTPQNSVIMKPSALSTSLVPSYKSHILNNDQMIWDAPWSDERGRDKLRVSNNLDRKKIPPMIPRLKNTKGLLIQKRSSKRKPKILLKLRRDKALKRIPSHLLLPDL